MKDTIVHVIIKYFQQQAQKEGYRTHIKSIGGNLPNYIEAHKTISITKRRWYSLKPATNIDIYITFYIPIYLGRLTVELAVYIKLPHEYQNARHTIDLDDPNLLTKLDTIIKQASNPIFKAPKKRFWFR